MLGTAAEELIRLRVDPFKCGAEALDTHKLQHRHVLLEQSIFIKTIRCNFYGFSKGLWARFGN